jgi:hypothetical protein
VRSSGTIRLSSITATLPDIAAGAPGR